METIKIFIDNYSILTDSEWCLIKQNFTRRTFSQNEIIFDQGKICNSFYFIESGLIRFFHLNEGNDITKNFVIAPYCFTSIISFRRQIPSNEGIQALAPSILWEINHDQFKKLEKIEAWNIFLRKISNEVQEYSEEIYLEAKIMTAQNRYQKLLQKYPQSLLQKIPLKHLSTFLGIAPQSLSRIRKKLHIQSKS